MTETAAAAPRESAPLTPEQRLWRRRILLATYFSYAGFYLTRKVFTICKVDLSKEFDVKMDAIGNIWVAYLVAYAAGQALTGYIGRKRGPRFLLLGGLAVSIGINVVFGFANSYWTFLSFMFFNGLAQAAGWPGCVGGISEWLRKSERGAVMGIWSTNYLIGNIMVKSLGGYLLGAGLTVSLAIGALKLHVDAGWRFAFFGCTLAAFAVWWFVALWQRDKPSDVGLPPILEKDAGEERAVRASDADRISLSQYKALLFNPVILLLGLGYFCLKFLRYALDSWGPTFLQYLHLSGSDSAYLSMIFDFVGLPGAILAGIALDRWFRGRWAPLCLLMGVGMAVGYVTLVLYGANPYAFAFFCGLVGFMLYGPDTLLCGAAAVEVAGEKNAVAVAGIINGLGSIGPVLQELVISRMLEGGNGMRNANLLGLGMSVVFVAMMVIITWQVNAAQKRYQAHNGESGT